MTKFNELIQGEKPVLVDFYADWCGPCQAMAPVLKQVAQKANGQFKVIKVDIDKNPQAAAKYGIKGVPTFILFKNGQSVWRHSGMIGEAQLNQVISQY